MNRWKAALNERQHLFVVAVCKGVSPSEAYRQAGYDCATEAVARSCSSRMLTNEKIRAALQAIRERAQERTVVTVETITAELEEARVAALRDGNQGAAVAASLGKAKLYGLLVDRKLVGVVQHKPALSNQALELDEAEWQRQFDPARALPHRQ